MRVGAEGGRPLPQGEGGPGGRPEFFWKIELIYDVFSIKFIVISYLFELFIFE